MLILDILDNVTFSIVSGIFMVVAKIYDLMLQIVRQDYTMDPTYFEQFATAVYVLAGVFMLFRTVIGLVQMLINPDQINDKQAGAGKIITRIITCIVMLMLFAPNGILFGQTGLFARVEDALLAEDGLVTNFMNLNLVAKSEGTKSNTNNNIARSSNNDFLIENVDAESKLTCYYINVQKHTVQLSQGNSQKNKHYIDMGNVFKVEFYSGSSGKQKLKGSGGNYTYSIRSDQRINGKDEYGKYASFKSPYVITPGNVFKTSFPKSCPKYLKKTSNAWLAQKNYPGENNKEIEVCDYDNNASTTNQLQKTCLNHGVMLAGSSFKEMNERLTKMKNGIGNNTYSVKAITDNPYIKATTIEQNNHSTTTDPEEIAEKVKKNYLTDIIYPASIVFAQGTASSLQECVDEKRDECAEAQHGENADGTDGMFTNSASNDTIVNLMSSHDLDIGFLISTLTGIALIVYLLYLCIEILVRKLKLYFLGMIAPLPIVCYIDPKDKIFNQWFKMYLSTYADLFIKLISIGIATNLLAAVFEDFWDTGNWLIKFFYIVAILVFAKLVPTMISKIFGLDSMGGSFKAIKDMTKAAAGFGVGAAIGGIAGFKTGQGLGRLGGLARGTMLGAGYGAKGKLTGGAQSVSAQNARINEGKANGLNFWQRAMAGMAGTIGYNPKAKYDNKAKKMEDPKKMLDDFRAHKDDIENAADKYAPLADLQRQVEQGNVSKTTYKNVRDDFIKAAERGDKWFNVMYSDRNGQAHSIGASISDSDRSKVVSEIENMKVHYNSSGSLQKEIKKANGNVAIEIKSYSDFKAAEGVATEKSMEYRKGITKVKSTDEYAKAQAISDYSKSSK